MVKSHMNFAVNENAVVCNLINGEIKYRMVAKKNPDKRPAYKKRGIIDSSPSIKEFMIKYPKVFHNRKLIHTDGSNFFDGILSLSPLSGTESYEELLKNRMRIEYDLTDSEIEEMGDFFSDFVKLEDSSDIKQIVNSTESYKNSIEKAWRLNERQIMKYVTSVLGYEPENIGKVHTYIMYPTFNTHRCYQLSKNKSYLYFGKSGEKDPNKILAYLSHQAVHQPILPYTSTMTGTDKEKFHAFIKFLTDKDVYNYLSGKSYLDIVTQNENPKIMGKVYPFWLGYRYRNDDKIGKNPVEEIRKAIERDKEYFDSLPLNSSKRNLFSSYQFEKLDPEKIALLFREKRSITPYQFAKIDFDRTDLVYKNRFISNKMQDEEISL